MTDSLQPIGIYSPNQWCWREWKKISTTDISVASQTIYYEK
jgi:hypothetical protein